MKLLCGGNYYTGCRAVLFDKDGTLIDFKGMWLNWLDYVFNSLINRYELNQGVFKELEHAVGVNLQDKWIDPNGDMASGRMEKVKDSTAAYLCRYGGEFEEIRQTFINTVLASEAELDWASMTHPVPGLADVLKRLKDKNVKMGVVTADVTRRADDALISLGISTYFDVVVGADRVKETKPAPDMALFACELMQVSPRETIIVGDNITDVCMGKNAGTIASLGVLTGVCGKEQLSSEADVVLDSVADITIE
ncbi:MAG: HAD family hydrolase [Clostridiales bacterium]|nr:HAD family hydrolase [Clostridiales bacterium]MCF8022977.1 HAD family hydrolase [Clostridiales bacterium]